MNEQGDRAETISIVKSAFERFDRDLEQRYRIGDPNLYPKGVSKSVWHHSQNQHLKTEADIQLKFGACLDVEVRERKAPISIHAEMPIYTGTAHGGRVDLSLHHLTEPPVWKNKGETRSALLAAIEIKYLNYVDPDLLLKKGGIQEDIKKLARLQKSVAKFLLVLDEAPAISKTIPADIVSDAKDSKVFILSNNEALTSELDR